jgi:mannose-6-phosphate isomerase-like protein (cupin superfamily)
MQVIDIRNNPLEVWRPGVETRMRVAASNGTMQLCIFEQWTAPGSGAPTHWHPVEEVLTVLEGQADVWMDDEHLTVLAGQSVIVPAGRKHGFSNSGTVTLHMHAVLALPYFERAVEGADQPTLLRWQATSLPR